MTESSKTVMTSGMLFVRSVLPAMRPHVEWAVGSIIGSPVQISWHPQSVRSGSEQGELFWTGPIGTGAAIVSSLRGWDHLWFEVTENPSRGSNGGRWMHTPALGTFAAQTDAVGDIVVSENRIHAAMESAGVNAIKLQRELRLLLGEPWDIELDAFRESIDQSNVIWLSSVG